MRTSSAVLLGSLAALAACSSAPPPLELPPAAVAVDYVALGSAAVASASPQSLHIEVLGLRATPAGSAVDLAAATIARERGAPFRGASSLPPGSRWLAGDAAAAWLAGREQLGPSELQVLGAGDVVIAPELEARVAVAIAGVPALYLRRLVAGGSAVVLHSAAGAKAAAEDVHLRDPLADGASALLFVPSAARDLAGHAVLLRPGPPPAATAVSAAAERARVVPPAPERWPLPWQTVFAAVGEDCRRPALLALARQLFAQRCIDVLLDADEPALIDVTAALVEVDLARDDVAWQFERAMWRALVPRLERDELPRAVHAMFLLHFGALADDGAAIGLLLEVSADGPAMCAAVREANVEALADRDAAMRVRANDWLRYYGTVVPDYAPLAPLEQRRAALRAYLERASAAETSK